MNPTKEPITAEEAVKTGLSELKTISDRKLEHIELCQHQDVEASDKFTDETDKSAKAKNFLAAYANTPDKFRGSL